MSIIKAHTPRPLVWGFFVCVVLAGVFFLVQQVEKSRLESNWDVIKAGQAGEVEAVVAQAFQEKLKSLLDVADDVRRSAVLERLREGGEYSTVEAFGELPRRLPDEESTIDIVDPRGTIIAWAGRSITSSYENFIPRNGRDSFAVILQSGLHTFLSAGIASDKKDFFVVASRPLELQYPISNRFVNRVSFAEELSKILETEVWIALNRTSHVQIREETRYALLRGLDGGTIGYVFYVPETLGSLMQKADLRWGVWAQSAVAIGLVFLGILFWKLGRRMSKLWQRLALVSVLIWVVRVGWRMLNVPSSIEVGQLFDATLYASPFYFGFTSSIGELLFSTLALCLHTTTLWYFVMKEPWGISFLKIGKTSRLFSLAVVFGILLLFLWSVRGYAEAFRTFVFDSTLQYHDPSAIIPDVSVSVMHVCILLLSVSLLAALLAALRVTSRLLTSWNDVPWWTIASAIFVFALTLFAWIDAPLHFPLYYPVLVFATGIIMYQWMEKLFISSQAEHEWVWKSIPVLLVASFIVSSPILDSKLHDKERQQVELFAENLLRPMDSWLSYVLVEGLRTVWSQFAVVSLEPTADKKTSLAFSLWAQTLMSREGYNSAIVLYDEKGDELSRFSVGMTAFEQREILTQLFDGEEEVVQVNDLPVLGGTVKTYGIWSTIRNEDGRVIGSGALMLSSSKRSLLEARTADILRAENGPTFESNIRNVALSEFQDGVLLHTGVDGWHRGMVVPRRIRDQAGKSENQFIWLNERIGTKEYENLYASREWGQGRIVVVNLQTLDLRWHIFNLVKVFFVYAAILLVAGLVRFGVRLRGDQPLSIGFRGKLVFAFGLLGLIPLFLLGYYNRQVAAERADENVRRTLSTDLDLVEQRILNFVSDEEDFIKGINNDFCEGVAPELGVDFAVFRRSALQSSSRPELYQSAILDSRLPGRVFANALLLEKDFYVETETIGRVRYAVGYKPLLFHERFLGVLSIPALYRQKEIDEELAQRNAFVFGSYAFAFGLILLTGIVLANRLSRPIRELTNAAAEVGRGNLDIKLRPFSSDEIGELTKTFNTMVQELQRSREELKRAERETAWKEMAKQVAHEIRNPLTPMKLSVQHLRQAFKDKARDREAILQEVAKTIIEQIDTLSRIASEFSNFGRMPERRFERIDVRKLLQESVSLFKDVRGIEFRTKFPDTPIHIVADGDELRRVFVNLLRNSVQAMKKGGLITVETHLNGRECVVRMADTGAGIPPEIQQKVFEPNFSTKTGGMGLGLAISEKTIKDLGGTISFTSEVGKGTTFEIILPYE
ncbi:MAG: HAMP domain-containing protein [Ignavibacteriales bacterium]|nr:HAMP domain-containing protein [Ignavibacteriales bacterium]